MVKIVYGDPTTFLSRLPTDSAVHCSKMWSCRKRISLENLGHVVQQRDGKDAVPLLWKFLQKVSVPRSALASLEMQGVETQSLIATQREAAGCTLHLSSQLFDDCGGLDLEKENCCQLLVKSRGTSLCIKARGHFEVPKSQRKQRRVQCQCFVSQTSREWKLACLPSSQLPLV